MFSNRYNHKYLTYTILKTLNMVLLKFLKKTIKTKIW